MQHACNAHRATGHIRPAGSMMVSLARGQCHLDHKSTRPRASHYVEDMVHSRDVFQPCSLTLTSSFAELPTKLQRHETPKCLRVARPAFKGSIYFKQVDSQALSSLRSSKRSARQILHTRIVSLCQRAKTLLTRQLLQTTNNARSTRSKQRTIHPAVFSSKRQNESKRRMSLRAYIATRASQRHP